MSRKRKRAGIVLRGMIAALFGIILFFGVWTIIRKAPGSVANIYQDGRCVYSVDLSEVKAPYEITIEYENGYNTIQIDRGKIAVKEADCPDGICVKTGWISDRDMPIVCLPHHMVIRLERSPAGRDTPVDAVAE